MPDDTPVTRLGPALDDGPGRGHGTIYRYGWWWSPATRRRTGLPWVGVFLVVLGGLLLVEQALPTYRQLSDVIVLAAGLASLVAWAVGRSALMLYAGAILTALALPGTITALGQPLGAGWGTLFLGAAFALVAAVRWARGDGVGWQAWVGATLVLVGAAQAVRSDVVGLALPIVAVLAGVALLVRGASGRARV